MDSNSKRTALLAVLCAVLVFSAAFLTGSTPSPPAKAGEDNPIQSPAVRTITQHLDYRIADSLPEMINGAQVIVVGEYTGLDSTWNMSRNPQNPEEESSEIYVEGLLYNFSVHEVLKGELDSDTILVNHRHSETQNLVESNAQINSEGVIIKEATESEEIPLTIEDPLFIEPEENVVYILFLRENQRRGHYYGAAEPFSIKDAGGTAELQSNLIGHTGAFLQTATLENGQTVNIATEIGAIEDTISGHTFEEVKEAIFAAQ